QLQLTSRGEAQILNSHAPVSLPLSGSLHGAHFIPLGHAPRSKRKLMPLIQSGMHTPGPSSPSHVAASQSMRGHVVVQKTSGTHNPEGSALHVASSLASAAGTSVFETQCESPH